MQRTTLMLAIFLLVCSIALGQDESEVQRIYSYDNLPPRELVDCPTAATLPRASFDFKLRTTSGGGLIAQINIGLHRRFGVGLSYGGAQVLGEGKVDWQDEVAVIVKYQFLSETMLTPAIAVGYDGQGYGHYFSDLKRFMYKSKGFYMVASKGYQTYQWASGLHVGAYYSLESDIDNDDDISFYFGADITLQNNLSLVAEYDLALSDNKELEHSGKGWGYFNFGLRWIFSERLELGLDFENMFDNRRDTNSFTRGLRITYLEFF